MTTPLDNLLDLDQAALKAYCERVGEKSFRATQLFR
jgi:adenine C2-methylase RlmN of 23S rRNA A2503 and tRNA A37